MAYFPCMLPIILTCLPIFRLGSGASATTAGPLDNPRAQDALLAAPPDAAPESSSSGTPRVVSPETRGSKDSPLQGADGPLVTLPSEPTWFRLNYVHPREERRLSSTWKRLAAGPHALLKLRAPTISPHLVRALAGFLLLITCYVGPISLMMPQGGGGGGGSTQHYRVPPSWSPEEETTYSFRAWCYDLQLWLCTSSLTTLLRWDGNLISDNIPIT